MAVTHKHKLVALKKRFLLTKRQQEALELRLAGNTLENIAGELGYSNASGVFFAIQSAMAKKQALLAEEAGYLRTVESERLDRLIFYSWKQVMAGDLRAMETVLRVSYRRAQLLGLDAPKQIEFHFDLSVLSDEELVILQTLMTRMIGQESLPSSSKVLEAQYSELSIAQS